MADRPEPGRDYPRDFEEFRRRFPDEAACVRYLEALSWPDGFVCPSCGAAGPPWRGSRRRLVCRACGHQTSVTAGTVFEGTRTPLRQWFRAAWLLAAAEQGVSARRLQRDLGLGSYETAWTMLHRYRRAMVRSGRPRLSGPVELAAAELAARPAAAAVGVAVEDRGAEPGRVRMQRLEGPTPPALAAFAARAVEPGAVRARDAATVAALAAAGYASRLAAALPHLDAVVVALGRWLRGTHQAAAAAHLDQYLDEFTFRFNRRSSTHPGLRFYRLLEEAVVTPPTPYRSLVAPRPSPNRRPPA